VAASTTHGHDAVHANDLAMHQCPDSELLRFTANDNRVTVRADLDFPRLLAGMGVAGPAIILLRGGNYSEAESLDCLRRVLKSIPPADLPESIVVVDRVRIRRRRLAVQ
jgi:predicted nuclease of predicted toxin-antitoxin system